MQGRETLLSDFFIMAYLSVGSDSINDYQFHSIFFTFGNNQMPSADLPTSSQYHHSYNLQESVQAYTASK